MDIGFFLQGSPNLLHNLLPEVKESMDKYSYGKNVACCPPSMKRMELPAIVANDSLDTTLSCRKER